jgi:hypothetical protein
MVTAVRNSPRTAPALPRSRHILSDPRHGPLPPLLLALTLTGIAADLHARNHGPALLRRLLAVATMLAGGAAGAWLVLRISPAAALGLAAALLALVTAGAIVTVRRPGTWRESTP